MTIPDVVRTYIDAFGSRNVDGCVGSFAPDGTYSDSGTAQPLSGEAISEHFATLFIGFPDATCETVALDPISDHLAAWRWIVTGTNTGSFRGMKPSGRRVVLAGCEFIEVRDALKDRVEGYYDRLTFLAQLGLAPGQPSVAAG